MVASRSYGIVGMTTMHSHKNQKFELSSMTIGGRMMINALSESYVHFYCIHQNMAKLYYKKFKVFIASWLNLV